ncbi:hypothetical protein F1559_003473 [Cyanidiococcus yangmingshanensis]|uniref:Uncharacterized protein n=1 Tax=Cyanidiococcus yangmingshanensis TaxID=2690220 RepID=A0A7J7IP30_9RHOD|nr:hypothetical protein F1559_003473 [Cyanidiococcus yangmingshanensis]
MSRTSVLRNRTQTNENPSQLESTREEHARTWNLWLRSRAERTIFAYLLQCTTDGDMPQELSAFQQSCYEILRREIQIKTARWCPRMETSVRAAITETLFTSPYLRFASGYVSATRCLGATCGASPPGSQSTSMDPPVTFNVIPVACSAHDHCRVCREGSPEAAVPQRTPSPPTSCVLALRVRHDAEASSLPQMPLSLTLGSLEEIPFDFDDDSTSMAPFLYCNEGS